MGKRAEEGGYGEGAEAEAEAREGEESSLFRFRSAEEAKGEPEEEEEEEEVDRLLEAWLRWLPRFPTCCSCRTKEGSCRLDMTEERPNPIASLWLGWFGIGSLAAAAAATRHCASRH